MGDQLDVRFCLKGHFEALSRMGDPCPKDNCGLPMLASLLPFFMFMPKKVH